ncbi:MAG TPA: copper resistance protein CopC, partial [Ktedonobacterales bacterium]|nr:copper resistance protein CopC [Ktedonobacterales bacterium]
MRRSSRGRTQLRVLLGSFALVALVSLTSLIWSPAPAQARPLHSLAPFHALPVKYDPAQNAVLRTPPTQVRITFNELVNPDISKIVVVNPSNQEVDNRDSQVSGDGYTMSVSLPFLPAGTYVVFWQTHSEQDGHVAGGSYIFHIAGANGIVPPLSGPLPTGHNIGGAGLASTSVLNGPTLLGAIARWLALIPLTLLLGMLFWMLVVQPRQPAPRGDFATDLTLRYRRVAQLALGVILAATILEIAAQALLLDGTPASLVSLPLLKSILIESRFGRAILIRLVFTVLGLLVLWLPSQWRPLLDRWAEVIALSGFGLGLALAYEYSGHGGSADVWWGPIIDFLHLVANGIWLGGIFTLAVVIVPVLRRRARREQRAYLMRSIPAFSVPALVAVAFVTVTGPLNATTRLTSVQQVWSTPYGLVLVLKSVLFL